MKTTPKHNERIATMKFFSVWPHYITKVVKKGRTEEDGSPDLTKIKYTNLLNQKLPLKPSLKKLT
mgnify:CR=1 FL=1